MDDAGDRCASAVVDVGHRAGNSAGSRYAAEKRRSEVGNALRHKLGVRVVVVADNTVGYGCRQQRLDSAEHGDGHSRSNQTLYCLPCHGRHLHVGYGVAHVEAVADGLDACDAGVLLKEQSGDGHNDDSHERTRYLLAELRRDGDNHDAHNAHQRAP